MQTMNPQRRIYNIKLTIFEPFTIKIISTESGMLKLMFQRKFVMKFSHRYYIPSPIGVMQIL